jgi:hypothetical protein
MFQNLKNNFWVKFENLNWKKSIFISTKKAIIICALLGPISFLDLGLAWTTMFIRFNCAGKELRPYLSFHRKKLVDLVYLILKCLLHQTVNYTSTILHMYFTSETTLVKTCKIRQNFNGSKKPSKLGGRELEIGLIDQILFVTT